MTRLRTLGLYAGWQLRDAVPKALAPVAIFAVIAGIPLAILVSQHTLAGLREAGLAQRMAVGQYNNTLPLALALGAIILMSGGASLDRERQHVRFLFSRPAAPWLYYLQQFVISTALFVAAMAFLPVFFGWLVADVPVVAVVKSAALYALAYGSLGLFCAALLNRDGIVFIGVLIFSQALQAAEAADQLGWILAAVANALPPLYTVGQIRVDWFAGTAAEWGDLRLVLGYGTAMLVASLWLIHRRPLVR